MSPLCLIHLWQGSIEKRSIHFSTCITPAAVKPCSPVGEQHAKWSSLFRFLLHWVLFLTFFKYYWHFFRTFPQPAEGKKITRTLRNTGRVYYCALVRRFIRGRPDGPGPTAEWTFCRWTLLCRLAISHENAKDERRASKQRKRCFPPWSFWHPQSPPATVVIEQREAASASRYSGEECENEKSVGVSWQGSCCSTILNLIPVARLHLAIRWPCSWTDATASWQRGSSPCVLGRKSYPSLN